MMFRMTFIVFMLALICSTVRSQPAPQDDGAVQDDPNAGAFLELIPGEAFNGYIVHAHKPADLLDTDCRVEVYVLCFSDSWYCPIEIVENYSTFSISPGNRGGISLERHIYTEFGSPCYVIATMSRRYGTGWIGIPGLQSSLTISWDFPDPLMPEPNAPF